MTNIIPIRNEYLPDELKLVPMWEVMRQLWDDHKGKRSARAIADGIYCVMDCFDAGMTPKQALHCGDLSIMLSEMKNGQPTRAGREKMEVGSSATHIRLIASDLPTNSSTGSSGTPSG